MTSFFPQLTETTSAFYYIAHVEQGRSDLMLVQTYPAIKRWYLARVAPTVLPWAVAGAFVVYLATSLIVARIADQASLVSPMLSAEVASPMWSRFFVLLFGLSGVAIALIVPGLAWVCVLARGRALRAASLFHRAFALNLIQATVFVSFWKMTIGAAPCRPAFIAWQALVASVGLLAMKRGGSTFPLRRDGWRSLLVGTAVLLVLLPAVLWDKIFVEDGSGDGTEAFEFSRSLATYQLPYWDLENGYYGFYPQFMLFAYPTQLSFITIGETEGAQRLPVFFYLLGIFLCLVELVRRHRRRLPGVELLLMLGAAGFFLVYHAHHSTYELVSDLAEPTGVDTFFGFLAASAFYALLSRQRIWWGIFGVLGCMALSAGLPFALLFLIGRVVVTRPRVGWWALRSHVLAASALLIPWMVYQLFVSIYTRFHPLGDSKWALATWLNRYPLRFDLAAAETLAVGFVVATAVVPIFGLAFLVQRDKIIRMLGLSVTGYFGFLLLFGRTHPHYLIPVSLFPTAILLRGLAASGVPVQVRRASHLAYGVLLIALTFMALPPDSPPHTAYRQFGARTLMLYDSYPAAVGAAMNVLDLRPELAVHLPEGKPLRGGHRLGFEAADWESRADELTGRPVPDAKTLPWGLSHHLWIRYADTRPVEGRSYDQVLAAPHLAPIRMDGYSRRELPGGWVLLFRPQSIFASPSSTGH